MLALYILVLIMFAGGCRLKKPDDLKLTADDTAALKGFSALLVLLHHLGQSSGLSGFRAFRRIREN